MYKKSFLTILFSTFIIALNAGRNLQVIPLPNHFELQNENFVFNSKTRWIVSSEDIAKHARELANCFVHSAHFNYRIEKSGFKAKNAVIFIKNSTLPEEGYTISANKDKIQVEASGQKGFFYAIQTIKQLLPEEIISCRYLPGTVWKIPAMKVSDAPRFGYRGFMLDVSRYFMPKKDVIKFIDLLAMHKINVLHLHLVDDNGWRIEIKKYPKLTSIGAWRVSRDGNFSMRSNPVEGEAATVGGFYSQSDIKEMVAYAKSRCIEIIPEIEMPAHTVSSLAAYPSLACQQVNHFIGVLPGMGGQNANDIYCAGNDSVFTFLEDVLSEIFTLFPSKYIHIGGDEANKSNWENCPRCQLRMKENNIPNENELQSYFIKRINHFLMKNNKLLMGWDELVDSELPEKATIFGWRGMGESAEKAGSLGFKYIKSPAKKYYFIRYQGPQWFEPYTYFGNTTLRDVYDYEPVNLSYPKNVTDKMLGIESCLWTEFVTNSQDAEYLTFPRLAAFAESAWTHPENKSWNNFTERIDHLTKIYDKLNVNYAKSMFNIDHSVKPYNKKLRISLSTIREDLDIRYTLDGSDPSATSQLYEKKIDLTAPAMIRAVTFKNNTLMGEILPLNILYHKATGSKVEANEFNAEVLTNGIIGTEKKSDGEWLNFYDKDGEITIDMDSATESSTVVMGMFNNAGMSVHLPAEITLLISTDNINFKEVYHEEIPESERFQNGHFRTNRKMEIGKQSFRYLKIIVKKPGVCPPNHIHPYKSCHMAFDEIILN